MLFMILLRNLITGGLWPDDFLQMWDSQKIICVRKTDSNWAGGYQGSTDVIGG